MAKIERVASIPLARDERGAHAMAGLGLAALRPFSTSELLFSHVLTESQKHFSRKPIRRLLLAISVGICYNVTRATQMKANFATKQ
eukprot:245212-Rhodomonas_salina.2